MTSGLSKKTNLVGDHSKKKLGGGSAKPLSKSPVKHTAMGKSTGAHKSPGAGISDMKKRGGKC